MATKTPVPPGPPPRGYSWPDQPPTGTTGPLGPGPTGNRTVVVQPGRHGITVVVGIVALLVGVIIGYQFGRGADTEGAAPTNTEAPTITLPPATTTTTAGGGGAAGGGSTEPLGTPANPIPVGQTWILGIWELTVHSTDLDAAETVTGASPSNPVPDDGSVYVLVDVELTLLDDLFAFAADFQPGLETADGESLDVGFEPCGPAVPDDFYDNGRLSESDPVRGNLCFEVPADLTDGLLLTTDGVGEATTYFALTE